MRGSLAPMAAVLSGLAALACAAALVPAAQAAPGTDYTSLGTAPADSDALVLIVSPQGLVAQRGVEATTYDVAVALPAPAAGSLAEALVAVQEAAQERGVIVAEAIAEAKGDATPEEWAAAQVVVRGQPANADERAAMSALAAALEREFGSDRVFYDVELIRLPGAGLFTDTLPPGEEIPAPGFWGGLFDRLR